MTRLYLCADGINVTGPFTLTEMRKLLAQHEICKYTLAFDGNESAWKYLNVCCSKVFNRPATAKQKALLSYLNYPDAENATFDEASILIEQEGEGPLGLARLRKWNTDRLRLYPELYQRKVRAAQEAEEIAREGRGETICSQCNDWKQEHDAIDTSYWPLKKLRIRQCKNAVNWLDANKPGWDDTLYVRSDFNDDFDDGFLELNQELIEDVFFYALKRVAPDAFKKTELQ